MGMLAIFSGRADLRGIREKIEGLAVMDAVQRGAAEVAIIAESAVGSRAGQDIRRCDSGGGAKYRFPRCDHRLVVLSLADRFHFAAGIDALNQSKTLHVCQVRSKETPPSFVPR